MELNTDKPRVIGNFDDFWQFTVRRHARKPQTIFFQLFLKIYVHLVSVPMTLTDVRFVAVNLRNTGSFSKRTRISALAHSAAIIAICRAAFNDIAACPFCKQPDNRFVARPEFR